MCCCVSGGEERVSELFLVSSIAIALSIAHPKQCEGRHQRGQSAQDGGGGWEKRTVSSPKLIVPTNLQIDTVGLAIICGWAGSGTNWWSGRAG